jgi:acyl carrier protein
MMTTRTVDQQGVLQAVYGAMRELRESGVPAAGPPQASIETPLFGPHGMLDSLGLVHLIVVLEDRLADLFGVNLTLADDKALSERRSPFRTVGSLTDYVVKRLTS